MPYDHRTVKLSDSQLQVEKIIARHCTDISSNCDLDFSNEKFRQQLAEGFAEHTMQQIEEEEQENFRPSPQQKLSILETLTAAAKKLMESEYNVKRNPSQVEPVVWLTDEQKMDRMELQENGIHLMNGTRLHILERWEGFKRKALDILTVEIEAVQSMDHSGENTSPHHFMLFRGGNEQHNSSTPKTNDEDESEGDKENEPAAELDDDDEDYVPNATEINSRKRKREKKLVAVTSTPKRTCPDFEFDNDASSPMITIGPNGTQIARASLEAINWSTSGPAITRKLLCEVFDRRTLAFHTLSGKPSPAFRDCARPSKQQLDPVKVADLVYLMTNSLHMTPREVRTAITTKCADENKMLRSRTSSQRRPRKSTK